jgi:hypothetical protein
MLAISPVIDDEPAAPAAPAATLAKKPGFDARSVNRKAVALWGTVFHMLIDLRGFPSGEIRALNPANAPLDPNRGRQQHGPRLVEFSGPDCREDDGGPGGWVCRGNGASGPDCISLVQYLSGGCDRRVAGDYLKSVTDGLVELPS